MTFIWPFWYSFQQHHTSVTVNLVLKMAPFLRRISPFHRAKMKMSQSMQFVWDRRKFGLRPRTMSNHGSKFASLQVRMTRKKRLFGSFETNLFFVQVYLGRWLAFKFSVMWRISPFITIPRPPVISVIQTTYVVFFIRFDLNQIWLSYLANSNITPSIIINETHTLFYTATNKRHEYSINLHSNDKQCCLYGTNRIVGLFRT